MDQNRIEFIYRKCLTNSATVEEQHEFRRLIRLPENRETAKRILLASFYENQRDINFDDISAEAMIEAILVSDKNLAIPTTDASSAANMLSSALPSHATHRVHFLKTAWFRYAAVFLLIAGMAAFLYNKYQPQRTISVNPPSKQPTDILPGGSKAILTLADGSTILLDSAANGTLASQGNTTIIKLNSGSLAYKSDDLQQIVGMNTITTPRGGQYQIVLSDGTKVWLNAASSMTFPTSFGQNREVTMTGEAYFEIAPDRKKPFRVFTAGMEVNVLGTCFNINAYSNESSINTTLAEGSIRITSAGRKILLKPRQQARLKPDSEISVLNTVNLDKILAWKNGLFNFDDASLSEVMKQLERWYDIDVVYEEDIPEKRFGGEISKDLNLGDVLDALRTTGVNFRLEEGRRLIVIR